MAYSRVSGFFMGGGGGGARLCAHLHSISKGGISRGGGGGGIFKGRQMPLPTPPKRTLVYLLPSCVKQSMEREREFPVMLRGVTVTL